MGGTREEGGKYGIEIWDEGDERACWVDGRRAG